MATTTSNPADCTAGDVGDTRTCLLSGVEDLSTATSVEAHVRYASDITQTATLDAAITDTVTREVVVQLGTDPTDWLPAGPAAGTWLLEVQVFWASAELSSEQDRIVVRDELG